MTKKKATIPERLKKLVNAALRRHAWNIGVSHFHGDIEYMKDDKDAGSGCLVSAEMVVDRRYLRATLRIFPDAIRHWEKEGDGYIEHLVAHETAHIATQHVMDLMTSCYKDEGETKDAWESLTEMLGRMSIDLDKLKKK